MPAACVALVGGCGLLPGGTAAGDGDTITVMTWAPEGTEATNKPGVPAFAQAYARWVNAHGGLGGHPLKVLTCNERNDNVAAAKCARRAIDEHAVAVVGSYSQHSESFMSPLQGVGIPYIGGYGLTREEFTSPDSYPVNGGQPALLTGLGQELAGRCGPVALVRPDSIAGDELPGLLDAGLKSGGHAPSFDQLAAEDADEYSGHARTALDRATADPALTGCVVPALGDRTPTFEDSFRRERLDHPRVGTGTVLGNVDQTTIDASGGKSGPYEGAYVTGWYPVADDPRWDTMKKVIKEKAFGDNRIDPADSGVQTTWIAYTVLRTAVESIGDDEVTARAIRSTLNNGLKVSTGSLTPPLSWRLSDVLEATNGLPRLVNTQVTPLVVRNGRLIPASKEPVDVTRPLSLVE